MNIRNFFKKSGAIKLFYEITEGTDRIEPLKQLSTMTREEVETMEDYFEKIYTIRIKYKLNESNY